MDNFVEAMSDTQNQLLAFLLISFAARSISRAIPDDRTGFAGFVRGFCKVVGLYMDTKIAPGVTISAVATELMDAKIIPKDGGGKPESAVTKIEKAAEIAEKTT